MSDHPVNPDVERDRKLFARLGLKPEQRPADVTMGETMPVGVRATAGAATAGVIKTDTATAGARAATRLSEAAVIAASAVAVAST